METPPPPWCVNAVGESSEPWSFRAAKGLRTAIRVRGTFTPAGNGLTSVDYWIEWKPIAVVALLISSPLSLGVLAAGFILAHIPLVYLWPFIPAVVLVIAANAYISERQAQWLAAFVRRELDTAS